MLITNLFICLFFKSWLNSEVARN